MTAPTKIFRSKFLAPLTAALCLETAAGAATAVYPDKPVRMIELQ